MGETIELANSVTSMGSLLDFLAWVDARPRSYAEAMDAWRTSCPRLSAWEDATGNELVGLDYGVARTQGDAQVVLTPSGAAFLRHHRIRVRDDQAASVK